MLAIKRVRFVYSCSKLKEVSIVARVRCQKPTRYVYILRSKCGTTPEMLKRHAVRNSCSKGNIYRSQGVLAETDMI